MHTRISLSFSTTGEFVPPKASQTTSIHSTELEMFSELGSNFEEFFSNFKSEGGLTTDRSTRVQSTKDRIIEERAKKDRSQEIKSNKEDSANPKAQMIGYENTFRAEEKSQIIPNNLVLVSDIEDSGKGADLRTYLIEGSRANERNDWQYQMRKATPPGEPDFKIGAGEKPNLIEGNPVPTHALRAETTESMHSGAVETETWNHGDLGFDSQVSPSETTPRLLEGRFVAASSDTAIMGATSGHVETSSSEDDLPPSLGFVLKSVAHEATRPASHTKRAEFHEVSALATGSHPKRAPVVLIAHEQAGDGPVPGIKLNSGSNSESLIIRNSLEREEIKLGPSDLAPKGRSDHSDKSSMARSGPVGKRLYQNIATVEHHVLDTTQIQPSAKNNGITPEPHITLPHLPLGAESIDRSVPLEVRSGAPTKRDTATKHASDASLALSEPIVRQGVEAKPQQNNLAFPSMSEGKTLPGPHPASATRKDSLRNENISKPIQRAAEFYENTNPSEHHDFETGTPVQRHASGVQTTAVPEIKARANNIYRPVTMALPDPSNHLTTSPDALEGPDSNQTSLAPARPNEAKPEQPLPMETPPFAKDMAPRNRSSQVDRIELPRMDSNDTQAQNQITAALPVSDPLDTVPVQWMEPERSPSTVSSRPSEATPNAPQSQLTQAHNTTTPAVFIQSRIDSVFDIEMTSIELGRVRMQLDLGDGPGLVMLQTERPETLDLLRRHLPDAHEEFREAGWANMEFNFGQGSWSDQADQNPKEDTREHVSKLHYSDDADTSFTNIPNASQPLRKNGALDFRF